MTAEAVVFRVGDLQRRYGGWTALVGVFLGDRLVEAMRVRLEDPRSRAACVRLAARALPGRVLDAAGLGAWLLQLLLAAKTGQAVSYAWPGPDGDAAPPATAAPPALVRAVAAWLPPGGDWVGTARALLAALDAAARGGPGGAGHLGHVPARGASAAAPHSPPPRRAARRGRSRVAGRGAAGTVSHPRIVRRGRRPADGRARGAGRLAGRRGGRGV